MVELDLISINGYSFTATHVALPKTHLLTVSNRVGYIMCGALDVELLRQKLASRGIIAARATGVRSIQELIEADVENCTQHAEQIGIRIGMPMKEALTLMGKYEADEVF